VSPAASGAPAGELFRRHCVKCHEADGTGNKARERLPEIPNFTDVSWQARRSDAQLRASILEGKGEDMPAHRGKISEEQARGLVAYVRAFAPTTAKSGPRQQQEPDLASFDKHYHRLEQEMDDLRRRFLELSRTTPGGASSKPSEPGQHKLARPSAPTEPGAPGVAELFRKRCVKCHEADGTGRKTRERLPEIPDFTNPAWQARRADSRLLASILDGKGEDMPAHRGKISEEQARSLVKYVRAFAVTKGSSKQGKQEGPTQSKPATLDPPSSSFEK
jgi:mono/diheme cytochrome c family protein